MGRCGRCARDGHSRYLPAGREPECGRDRRQAYAGRTGAGHQDRRTVSERLSARGVRGPQGRATQAQLNIEHYRRKLATEADAAKRLTASPFSPRKRPGWLNSSTKRLNPARDWKAPETRTMDRWSSAKICDVANLLLGSSLFFSPWLWPVRRGRDAIVDRRVRAGRHCEQYGPGSRRRAWARRAGP